MAEKGTFQKLKERAEAEKEVSFYGNTLEDVIRVSEEQQSKDPHKVTVKIDFEKMLASIPEFSGKSGSMLFKELESLGIYLPPKEFTIEIPTLASYYENIKNMEAKKQKEQGDGIIESKESKFSNWARTVNLSVTKCHPKNIQDLKTIIQNPDYRDKKISLAASAHSWPNLFGFDNSVLIDFMIFNSFSEPKSKWERAKIVNQEECLVDVSAGCSILQKHVNLGFFKDPMLIPSNVIFTDGQYVGVSSTGCHGCSFEYGTISDQIQSINFLDCEGNNQRLDCEKDIAELRSGAIGLGSYGIITEMRLKMVPNILVVTESHNWTLDEAKWHLVNRPADWISFGLTWWPFYSVTCREAIKCILTGRIDFDLTSEKISFHIVRHVRTEMSYDEHSKSYLYPDKIPNYTKIETDLSPMWLYIIQEILVYLRKYLLNNYPINAPFPEKFTPLFHKIMVDLMNEFEFFRDLSSPKVTKFFYACHNVPYLSAIPVLVNDIELCIRTSSIENDFNNFDNMFKAIEELRYRIQDDAYYGRFPVTICVSGRIVAGSPCPLAPCYSANPKELFFYLETLAFQQGDNWKQFAKVFFEIFKSIDPKVLPSMGKEWTYIEGMYEHIKEVCKLGLQQLKELQLKYDKDGRFMSPVVEKLMS